MELDQLMLGMLLTLQLSSRVFSSSMVPGMQWRPGSSFQNQNEVGKFRGRTEIAPDQRENHAGYLEEGKSFFNRMTRSLGIQPNSDHFGCLVDILCRAGDLNGAQEINASTHATTSTCQHLEFPCKWLQNPPTDGCCWKHHRKSCKHMDITLCCLTCMQKKKVKGEVYRRSRVRV
ncbi:hypothetical protein M9H77_28499 [Catharanthus roseus]|uniref:Uncharacterized protein n=1 Tax=Catharanthus roseus TaxID=4058 RepID=A0ACC0AGH8_CATRO|nr:hypothetical protein M9H77_28499 [Catharanthus roseus]